MTHILFRCHHYVLSRKKHDRISRLKLKKQSTITSAVNDNERVGTRTVTHDISKPGQCVVRLERFVSIPIVWTF